MYCFLEYNRWLGRDLKMMGPDMPGGELVWGEAPAGGIPLGTFYSMKTEHGSVFF